MKGFVTLSPDGEKFLIEYDDGSQLEYRGNAKWSLPPTDPLGELRDRVLIWNLLLNLPARIRDSSFELSESNGKAMILDGEELRTVSVTFSPAASNVPALWLNIFVDKTDRLQAALIENRNLIDGPECGKAFIKFHPSALATAPDAGMSTTAIEMELFCWNEAEADYVRNAPRTHLRLQPLNPGRGDGSKSQSTHK